MTLESTTVKKSYAGDDSTVAFPTTFIFWAVTDIEVILLDALGVETTWVEGTQYDLTGGSGAVGTVTVKTVPTDYTPATGETLLIRSNRDDIQDDAFPLGGAFPSVTVEQAFDQLTRLIQQRTEELSRVLTVKKTSELDGIEVPDPVTGQILIGNAAADGYDNSVPSAGSVILNDNDLGTSQTQATSQNSIFEFIKNTAVTMINKTITGIFTGPLTGNADTATLAATATLAVNATSAGAGGVNSTPGGDFTGGSIKYWKVGNAVTITWEGLTFSSAAQPQSAAGAIPAGYVPAANNNNIYYAQATVVQIAFVGSTGLLQIDLRDWAGAGANGTAAANGSMSYVVD